ncbi:hypothetical protein NM688_g994 [Phlebia brevispora]|uniref:Uncharacterized protein n=1 Tax=Phlebia brevispora TaxID=194682 RepID=A0ACC1TCS3_9APHY|nr:hypothetical protein NM688_g994 [Phlebia brevispora]
MSLNARRQTLRPWTVPQLAIQAVSPVGIPCRLSGEANEDDPGSPRLMSRVDGNNNFMNTSATTQYPCLYILSTERSSVLAF